MNSKKPRPTKVLGASGAEVLLIPAPKRRNAVQRAALQQKAGEHGPSLKAQRKRANDTLRKLPLKELPE
jgi:hypothetical protein